MRLIDADALEADLRKQYVSVFHEAGRKVSPEDYFIERHAVYHADVVMAEMNSFFEYLRTRPTVTSVKHGRWIYDSNGMDWGLGAWLCSECNAKNDNLGMGCNVNPYLFVGSKYCPNCGARMEVEE